MLCEASAQTPVSTFIGFSCLVRSLSPAWLMGHWPATLVPHLQLILEHIWDCGFGWAVTPLEPEGLVTEGGALQARWLRGQGLRLQLKGVTKGACSQAVQGLDSNPEEERETSASESFNNWAETSYEAWHWRASFPLTAWCLCWTLHNTQSVRRHTVTYCIILKLRPQSLFHYKSHEQSRANKNMSQSYGFHAVALYNCHRAVWA